MSEWNHKFRVEQIGTQSTIQGLRPGEKIAKAITEIQDKAVTEVELIETSGDSDATIVNGTLRIRISSGNDIPDGRESNNVLMWNGNEWETGCLALDLKKTSLDLTFNGRLICSVPVTEVVINL